MVGESTRAFVPVAVSPGWQSAAVLPQIGNSLAAGKRDSLARGTHLREVQFNMLHSCTELITVGISYAKLLILIGWSERFSEDGFRVETL